MSKNYNILTEFKQINQFSSDFKTFQGKPKETTEIYRDSKEIRTISTYCKQLYGITRDFKIFQEILRYFERSHENWKNFKQVSRNTKLNLGA